MARRGPTIPMYRSRRAEPVFTAMACPRLAEAVEHFNRRDLAFCVHEGDLIEKDWKSFDDILKPLAASRHRWHHLLGNHDFDA